MSDSLVASLANATDRYQSVHLAVFHWEDSESLARAAERSTHTQTFGDTRPAENLDVDRESFWSVWVGRPYRRRVEKSRTPDGLFEIAGGNENVYWQHWPASHKASLLPHAPDQDETPVPLFLGWLPPAASEMLDPSILLRMPEGSLEPIRFVVAGQAQHARRSVLRVRAEILDWHSRTPWAETLRIADDYELLVDEEIGAILRVASRVEGREVCVYEVFDIQWNLVLHPGVFELAVPTGTLVSGPNELVARLRS